MKVSEIGEFGLIDRLAEMIGAAPDKQLIVGIGDDTAAWHGDSSIQLATIDSLIQNTHFSLDTASWEEVGWKALAVNLSDIAAMGGLPKYALVSLALPDDTEVEDVTALYRGMLQLAKQLEVAIVGGNVSSALQIAVHVTVLGSTGSPDKHILTRSAASPGDKIAVTGYLGAAAAGLEMLRKHLTLEPEATASFRKAFLRPSPRIAEGQLLVGQGVKAAVDISDGMVADLAHICQSSRVGARVEVDRVPIFPLVKANFADQALALALAGEDYELLFTGSSELIDEVRMATSCPITVVGEIVADKTGEIVLVDSQGNPVDLPRAGWDHFSTR